MKRRGRNRRHHPGPVPTGEGAGPPRPGRPPARLAIRDLPSGPASETSGERESVRIQKILAQAGPASRREAEEWICEGRVSVNGRVARLGDRADPWKDAIRVDGKRIRPRSGPKTYILLNKPRGYVTTVADPQRRDTVLDLLPGGLRRGVKPVGRLDVQTEGLLLLTDDGDLARDLTNPAAGCPKEYRVKVSGTPAEKDLDRVRRGIFLDGRPTRPAIIERIATTAREGNTWLRVVLTEGRNRQVRRMFEAIGHPVSKLKRVAIGPVRDDRLPPGAHRKLTEAEVRGLRKWIGRTPSHSPVAPSPRHS
jgi:23S rRNA pseudouridine2605 synthase